jgi:hypothetical protein
MVVFMMFSSKCVVLCPYTMKTIPVIKTDRPGKKRCGLATTCEAWIGGRGAMETGRATSLEGAILHTTVLGNAAMEFFHVAEGAAT